jgi:site-specific recombinase XerD
MNNSEQPDDSPGNSGALAIIEPATGMPVPAMIAAAGERASLRFIDFFTAHIRNANTSAAYGVAVRAFFEWLQMNGVAELGAIRTHHVSTYVELLTQSYSARTVKQRLAAIRRLFDWLIVGQVVGQNAAAPVRGPTHVVKKGKTPVLLGDEARALLDSIDVSTIVGLRDRALIALLIYSFARISAALQMNIDDYYPQGKRWWVRLHEKGGKQHEMPAHHLLEQCLDAYVTAAGLASEKNAPLFPTLGGRGRKQLTGDRMSRQDARRMIVRRPPRPAFSPGSAVTASGRPASPSICSTAVCSNTRSRWRRTRARARPSSMIAATTRSRSIRSSGLFCKLLWNDYGRYHLRSVGGAEVIRGKICFQ